MVPQCHSLGVANSRVVNVCSPNIAIFSITLGSYLVSIMLKFINSLTGERWSPGWIPENLNEGHLDQFFWLMAGMQLLNVLVFAYSVSRYKRKLAN